MIEAGIAAAGDRLEAGTEAERLVAAIFTAMARQQWRPIATAPVNGTDILLGAVAGEEFLRGIGRWVPPEDDVGGSWSIETWWRRAPTHWQPLPPAPADWTA
jgi:hypothetical protein